MKEIIELEDKYLVLKKEDLDRFFSQFTKGMFTTKEERRHINKIPFNAVLKEIQAYRKSMGKKDNRYVVLKLDDEIDFDYLLERVIGIQKEIKERKYEICRKEVNAPDYFTRKFDFTGIGKVSDIAVALVNAILKAKEKV